MVLRLLLLVLVLLLPLRLLLLTPLVGADTGIAAWKIRNAYAHPSDVA